MTAATTWDFASIENKIDYADDNFQTLLSSYSWSQKTITFSFPLTAFPGTGFGLPQGELLEYSAFTQAEVEIAIETFNVIERFLNIDFVYDASGHGDIKIGHQNMTMGGYAQQPYPGSDHAVLVSDTIPVESLGYGIQVLIHEVGHALGLDHPHELPTPLNEALDLNTATIMSYDRFVINGDGGGHVLNSFMPMDILALQSLYGVSTKVTNDVYTADNGISVIADYGGVDKLDISTQSYDQADVNIIDLHRGFVFYDKKDGGWESTVYDVQSGQWSNWVDRNADNGFYNIIIMPGSSIETVVGSGVRDLITGDDAANSLTGGGGDDALDGGGGIDVAVYAGNYSNYTVLWNSVGSYTITDNVGTDGTDTLSSIEFLRFLDGDIGLGTAPVLVTKLDDQEFSNATPFAVTIDSQAFADPNGDVLTYSARLANGDDLPIWLDFDSSSRTLSGTPGEDDFGTITIVVTASDGTESASDSFTLTVYSAVGEDIVGNVGPDNLIGTKAGERMLGLEGNDTLRASLGSDTLIGGKGMDTLSGELGSDVFLYEAVGDSMFKNGKFDSIMDFSRAEGDLIDVSALDANLKKKGYQGFSFDPSGDGYGKTGQISYWVNEGKTHVYGNIDKDQKAEFYVVLTGEIDLQQSDFVL